MGNWIGVGTSQSSAEYIIEVQQNLPGEGEPENTTSEQPQEQPVESPQEQPVGPLGKQPVGTPEEQAVATLLQLASDFSDDMGADNRLMSHVRQNQDLLEPKLHAILEELHHKVSCSSEEPSRQNEVLRCLTVLGSVFPRKILHFLVKKMDEVWNDTALVFHTINIMKHVVHSNGEPAASFTHTGLEALDYQHGLLTKLLVIAGAGSTSGIRVAALELLSLVDSMIHEEILDLWLGRITSLLQYLKRGTEMFKQKQWENMLLVFLEDTVFQIDDELWVNYFIQSLIIQLSYCSTQEKKFIYKCWGATMKASMGTFIQPSLWRMVQEIRFDESEEREGFAFGLGICAMRHMEDVLSILEEYQCFVDQLSTPYYTTESSQVPITMDQMRSLLLISYYFVALLAPREIILPIMKPDIFPSILQNYPHCLRDPLARSAFICSVILVCQVTMETDAECSLQSRPLVRNYLKDILQETPKCLREVENCQKAIKALTLLGNSTPLEQEEKLEVIDLGISSIMKFPPWDIIEKTEEFTFTLITQSRYHRIFEAVYEVIRNLIEWHLNPETLHSILKALESWLVSPQTCERERATRAVNHVLQIYKDQVPAKLQESIEHVGSVTGVLLPRSVENRAAIRLWARTAINCLFNLQFQHKSENSRMDFLRLLKMEEHSISTVIIFQTAMTIINYLPSEELMPLLHTTLDGMMQNESWCEPVADILKIVLQQRATELQDRVAILVYSMYDILDSCDTLAVKRAVRRIIGALAYKESRKVVTILLTFSWLDMSEIRVLWRSFIADKTLFPKVLSALLRKIPQKDQGRNKTNISPSSLPNTITTVIWEFVAAVERKDLLEEKQEALFFYCFVSIPGCSTQLLDSIAEESRTLSCLSVPGTSAQSSIESNSERHQFPSFAAIPRSSIQMSVDKFLKGYLSCSQCSVAVLALQNILRVGGCEHHLLAAMNEDHGWELMMDAQEQHKGFAALGRAMKNCVPCFFPRNVVQDFVPNLYSSKEAFRKDYAAFFAEFLASPYLSKDEKKMMVDVYSAMKLFIYDENPILKMYGIRGLSNAIHTVTKEVSKHKENILDIFLRSLSDPWYPIVRREAMSAILKILPYFSSIRTSTSSQLALQAQSLFDDENPFIRQSALELFGQLSRFFYWRTSIFSKEVENSLAHLLIHLTDDDIEVAETSKVTLWRCAPFIRYKPVRNLILTFLRKGEPKLTTRFLRDVSRMLVQDCPGKLNNASATRAAAACRLIGHLMQQEEKEEYKEDQ